MFRSSSELPNPLEPVIKKATDETLTLDNWEYILDACDQVSSDPEDGARNAIAAIEKRMKIKDGNVLLRTLSLITALAENCGSKMKQEIATRRFCNILKDLIKDRHTYLPIKYKIVEMIDQLTQSFASDPSLRIVSDTYKDIKLSYPDLVVSYKPQKPQKHDLTLNDRLKEQEELDLALKLSLQEYEGTNNRRLSSSNTSSNTSSDIKRNNNSVAATPAPQPLASTGSAPVPVSENDKSNIATVSRVKALYDLTSYEPDELSFKKGDVITVIESVYKDWWRGSLGGKIGIFPLNYVTPLKEPTTEELMEELKLEHLLLTKSSEVEKLLSLLSNFSTRLLNNRVSNEELSSMVQDDQLTSFYKDVVSLRPQLAKLIEKYSMKKDEMVALNKKLVDSERMYNELMESSFNRFMGQGRVQPPAQPRIQAQPPAQPLSQPQAQPQNAQYQQYPPLPQQFRTSSASAQPQVAQQHQQPLHHLAISHPLQYQSTPYPSQYSNANYAQSPAQQASPYPNTRPLQPPQPPLPRASSSSVSGTTATSSGAVPPYPNYGF